MRRVSDGKVRLEFYDPEPFSDTEDRAMAYGLQGVPLDQGGSQIYFGLAGTNLEDDERTIPFFQAERERFLEYDLTKLVYELSNPKRPVVGVMSSLPLDGDPRTMMMTQGRGPGGQPYASAVLLRQTNTVKTVPTDAQVIDPDIQVLLVAEAQNLSPATLYAIDQFVMRGGKLMAMVDPWSEAMAATPSPTGMPPQDTHSDLKTLFDAWGIEFDPTKVVGDLTGAWRVRAGSSDRVQAVNYVAWFNIRDGINHDDPATADLQQVTVASSGFLAKAPNASIDFTPLLTSSDRSGLIPVDEVKTPDPGQGAGRLQAGGRAQGDRRAGAWGAEIRLLRSAAAARRPEAAGQLSAVQGADRSRRRTWWWWPTSISWPTGSGCDMADFFGQQTATPFSDNGPFVANLIGTLAGSDALIGLRSRGDTNRPFTLVAPMQSEAEAQFRQTQQALQQHLDDVEKQLRTLRSGATGDRRRQCQARCRDHARSARRDRRGAPGHAADAAEAAGRAVGAEPRHLPARDGDAGVHHRAGAGAADGAGDRHGRRATTPAREGPPMRATNGVAVLRGTGHHCRRGRLVFRHRHDTGRTDDGGGGRADVPRSGADACRTRRRWRSPIRASRR